MLPTSNIPAMKKSTRVSAAFVALALTLAPAQAQDVSGRWEGELPFSGVIDLEAYALELTVEGDAVTGSFFLRGQELPLSTTQSNVTPALAASLTAGSICTTSPSDDILIRRARIRSRSSPHGPATGNRAITCSGLIKKARNGT